MNSKEENRYLADAIRFLSGSLQRMAYTANIELCHELYELSGRKWKGVDTVSYRLVAEKPVATNAFDDRIVDETALYDLGYLLRKVPASIEVELQKRIYDEDDRSWSWGIVAQGPVIVTGQEIGFYWTEDAGSPEDAVCMLVIELFKRGILGHES